VTGHSIERSPPALARTHGRRTVKSRNSSPSISASGTAWIADST
jgi:hypothetical protein